MASRRHLGFRLTGPRPIHRPALAATGADAAIIWGVAIGFGAILTGAYLTTRKPKH